MLEVLGLAKSFGLQTIFENFDLNLPHGRFTVLVGPSGCGKSTLFDCLTGIVCPDQGRIVWQGNAIAHLGSLAAYMQQKDMLLPWLTLEENSLLPVQARPRTLRDMKQAKQTLARIFERIGLTGFGAHYPYQVSGGMRQRCALARTLMFDRDLVLLDEPLSALDAITRRELQNLLLMLQKEFGKTVLMITHDIEEALVLADEIILVGPTPMTILERFQPKASKPREFTQPEFMETKARILSRLLTEKEKIQG
ncbi:ABC transporter ATP-binding protein [Desulfobacter hydrogenophilus]|uniref:ABC transporter ATP-binding protein n=1 Tax=Desulfobacter hydrogenophilus TaxID=2291 RepID=A0A328FDM6_9BACT|nr:ABC transporter ATP-binding protein [Desulfobacter hydrogenophilus]NDY71224.1 ABC transporter ATP-binding protein [Desulfobacter hydrogenophilus]QBH15035.1 ABC transporter ATP-binding protein [Desulfobacter hydrogenophilus]RAM02718.1 ABC transporter ATP-binding protein [Desulfobacter hydrogenophilus]